MGPDEYAALVDGLADDVEGALAGADGPDEREDALWAAVGAFVPEMERPVCEAVLANADAEPMDDLVDEVAAMRDSDDDEQVRAEAFTALLQDVNARVAARGGYE
ncbi:hypothetical protein [Halostella litorea]|uniref:hypothetical protein n=1 Tax=Halostella litorea TaxID=2528831 RepID=UPI001092C9EB|nr:hypothetical protein [Halostella litorea]